jgi:putative ABC transport system permease protein
MTGFMLARRTAARYKTRTALAVAGVAIIAALNFDMLLLSRGLLLSFANMIDSAGFDVRVTASSGLPTLRVPVADARKLADAIRRLPEVDEVAIVKMEPALASAPDGRERWITLVGTTEASTRGGWTVVRGRNLDGAGLDSVGSGFPVESEREGSRTENRPVVMTRQLASDFGLEPGSVLRIRAGVPGERSVLPFIEFQVIGIADFSFEPAGEYTVATTLAGLRALAEDPRDEADIVLVASKPATGSDAAVAAIARLRPDLHVYSNQEVVEQFNRNGFAYFRQISLVLSATTVAFTFLLVATLLTVSVNQRLGEIAALRAIGISRRRVAGMLLWESALLVGVGGAIALPLGGAIAVGLDHILRRMPNLPEPLHFFVFEPRAVVLHAAVLAVTAVVAALYPVRLAVTLPIAATLRRELGS